MLVPIPVCRSGSTTFCVRSSLLPGKECGEIVDLLLERTKSRRGIACLQKKPRATSRPCTVEAVRDLIRKFEETGCTCDQSRSGLPSVSVEAVAEVHATISEVPLASAHAVSRVLQLPNSTIRKILRSVLHMFPYRF